MTQELPQERGVHLTESSDMKIAGVENSDGDQEIKPVKKRNMPNNLKVKKQAQEKSGYDTENVTSASHLLSKQ
jgi:hypothetical protein